MLIQAYFDETGTHTGPLATRPLVMCVAGYLFTDAKAQRFSERWDSALRQAGLAYFRMSECASGHGQFEGWQPVHRERFAKSMAGLIREHITHGVGVWLSPAEFDLNAPTGWQQHYGNAYTACLIQCLALVAHWAGQAGYQGKIAYFFESGDKNAGEANGQMNGAAKKPLQAQALRYGGHSFVPKGSARGIEAADLLAWQLNKIYNSVLREGGTADEYMSPLFRYLHDGREASYSVQSLKGETLRNWFALQKAPPPPPAVKRRT